MNKTLLFGLSLILTLSMIYAVPTPSAYWSFDVDATDDVGTLDLSSTGSPSWTASGKVNGAYNYDGSSAGHYVGTDALIEIRNGWTLCYWVKGDAGNGNNDRPIHKDDGSSGHYSYSFLGAEDYNHYYYGTTYRGVDPNDAPTLTDWNYNCIVNQDNGTVDYYRNNVLELRYTGDATATTSNGDLNIGYCQYGYFDGIIDEVATWQSALSCDSGGDCNEGATLTSGDLYDLWNSGNGLSLLDGDAPIQKLNTYAYRNMDYHNKFNIVNVSNLTVVDSICMNQTDCSIPLVVNMTESGSNISAYFGGVVYGDAFVDNTPYPEGEVTEELKQISGTNGELDDSTLPEECKYNIYEYQVVEKTRTNENGSQETYGVYEEVLVDTKRNIGCMLSYVTKGTQENIQHDESLAISIETETLTAETIYTLSKMPKPGFDYASIYLNTNLSSKDTHYAVNTTMHGEVLDMEKRIEYLEGAMQQIISESCLKYDKYSWCQQ